MPPTGGTIRKGLIDMEKKVDVIIPVYRPTEKFLQLLDILEEQSHTIEKIIVVNTGQEYFEKLVDQTELMSKHKKLIIRHILKEEFDHGKTRNYGVSYSDSPYFIMMTDDAIPADTQMVERLLAPFEDETVGMTYARQLPGERSGAIERYTRSFNYPDVSCVKSAEDLKSMGIKAFFASNVCAAYRRVIFNQLNGFVKHTIFNEDMIYARRTIDAGYKIAYAAEANVIHCHNYSGIAQFQRNFDLGVSHAAYPEIFSGLAAESEGIRLVKKTGAYLIKNKKPFLIFKLIWQSGCKYIGYFLGKHYEKLPRKLVKACSMNHEYWKYGI